jgi:tetratricopeptide (TPR) repeat protein
MHRDRLISLAIGVCLVVATVTAYWGVWNLEFVYFDDPGYVSQNAFVKLGLNWGNLNEQVRWAFTSLFQSNWHPLTWLSHMLDCQMFGGSLKQSGGHHVTNLVLHAANTLLLFFLLRRMTGAAWPSGFVAALFAVHPLHVESVAWVAERKDVLSTFFGLLTLHAYVSYARRPMRHRRILWVGALSGWIGIVWSIAYFLAIAPWLYPSPVILSLPLKPTLWVAAILTAPALVAYAYISCVSWRHFLVFAGFAVGLLAKPMLVTLPCVFLLLDYWPLGRIRTGWPRQKPSPEPQRPQRRPGAQPAARRSRKANRTKAPVAPIAPLGKRLRVPLTTVGWLILEKLPLLVLAAASSAVTCYAQEAGGAMAKMGQLPLEFRRNNAVVAYLAYIGKMFVPQNMGVLYMLPERQDPDLVLLGVIGLLAVTAAVVWAAWYGRRYLAVGWFWYLGTLVPVIGLVQVGDQWMADRYAYVPLVGLFLMAAWGAADLIDRWPEERPVLAGVAAAGAAILIAGCILVTRHQVPYWHDTVALFDHALAVDSRNCKARNNLAVFYWEQSDEAKKRNDPAEVHRLQELALDHWAEALKLQPKDPYTQANLGHLLFEASTTEPDKARREAKINEAIEHCRIAIQQRSILPEPHNTLGRIYWARANSQEAEGKHGRTKEYLDEAVKEFREALKYDPGLFPAKENLIKILIVLKKFDEAQSEVSEMLKLDSNRAGAWICQAMIYQSQQRMDEALDALRHAVEADPKNVGARENLAMGYWQQGKRAEAMLCFRHVLRASPNPAAFAEQFGEMFRQHGNRDEAARAWAFMAWALATSPVDSVRNGPKALDLSRRAVDLSKGQNAAAWDAMAAAYAATGQFPDAVRSARQGLALADKAGDARLAQALRARIALYQTGQPLRETWDEQ